MRSVAAVLILVTLAACGRDGAPVPPTRNAPPEDGVRISGEARIGVSKTW